MTPAPDTPVMALVTSHRRVDDHPPSPPADSSARIRDRRSSGTQRPPSGRICRLFAVVGKRRRKTGFDVRIAPPLVSPQTSGGRHRGFERRDSSSCYWHAPWCTENNRRLHPDGRTKRGSCARKHLGSYRVRGSFAGRSSSARQGRLHEHLGQAGIGSVSEIFDAEDPFTPRGCIAQAWSVAELIRATAATRAVGDPPPC